MTRLFLLPADTKKLKDYAEANAAPMGVVQRNHTIAYVMDVDDNQLPKALDRFCSDIYCIENRCG